MAKNYRGLQEQVQARPGARERIERLKEEHLAQVALHELRRRKSLSQQELARRLSVGQPAVSKIEHGTDLRLSTIRNYVEAVGGELEIRVRLGDEELLLRVAEDDEDYR